MQNSSLYALFQSCFPPAEDAVFLEHERGLLKYADLDVRTGKIVHLLQNLGVSKGDRVMVMVDKSPEAIELYLACLRAGTVYVPLNTAYTADEISYYVKDAEPELFVCTPRSLQSSSSFSRDVPHVLTLDEAGKGSFTDLLDDATVSGDISYCAKDDLACILYTSGTTGRSKGAMLSHENLASNVRALHAWLHWQDNDVLLHALPIFHVHGLFVALHCALLGGSRVIYLNKFDLDLVKQSLPRSTVMTGVPTYYVRLLSDPEFNRELCSSIRLFSSASAPLSTEIFDELEKRTGHRILERYGMTESLVTTSNPCHGLRIAGTVGFPLPGIKARIMDDLGNELPAGEAGILEFTGPNVFQGYWRMPEKTEEEFSNDGYFISGDIATMDADGRISIVGRAKDLVVSGGYNVYPKEVELVIDAISGVKESAVIGIPHPELGEAVTAVIVKQAYDLTVDDILTVIRLKLARFKQPRQVIFLEDLPRNAMGKVRKTELRDKYNDIYTGQK